METPETPQERYQVDIELRKELTDIIEDSVAYFCNEHKVSGELAYLILECYATAKVEMFRGNVK